LCHPLVLPSPTLMMHGHMNLKSLETFRAAGNQQYCDSQSVAQNMNNEASQQPLPTFRRILGICKFIVIRYSKYTMGNMFATCTCTIQRSECIGRIFVKTDTRRVENFLDRHFST